VKLTESYDEIGRVALRVHLRGEEQRAEADRSRRGTSWLRRALFSAAWLSKLMRARRLPA